MSFQSLLESTECGATNPILDLARQFTSSATSTNVTTATGGDILSLDELNALNEGNEKGNELASAIESILNNNDNVQSSFNMESLLEEMNRMESQMGSTSNHLPDSSTDNKSIQNVFMTNCDPMISNHPPSIEENFWNEVTDSTVPEKNLLDYHPYSNKIRELNTHWADEYLKKLELNNNSLDNEGQKEHKSENLANTVFEQEENVWDLNEKEHIQSEQKAYRNQTIENVNSFFSNSYLPLNQFLLNSDENEVINDINLNDLVSDQESRLINMLLGNNLSNENQISSLQVNANQEKELEDQINQESPIETQSNPTQQKIDVNNHNQEEISKESENFFYKNQFDDMEFWMKLAEEWHSTDTDSTELFDIGTTHFDRNGRIIREPLKDLLDENHPYHYQYVENNPFMVKEDLNETQEKKNYFDYVEEGIRRMKAGDLSAAVLLFEAATQQKSEDANTWRLLGIAHAKNENDHKSILALKRCLALNPPNEIDLEALLYLATSFTNESMTTEACYALKEWLRQHPKYKDLISDPQKSEEQKKQSYLGPTPLSQRWADKKNIFSDGLFESVKEGFINAVKNSPDVIDPDVQCGLGILHNLSGEYEKATDCFRAALASRPDDYCLWNRYGASLANGGKAEESMFAYREALIRYPGFIRARYNLAISCIMLGYGQQACEHLLTILNLQTAGADSIKELVSLNRDNITSASVWNLMRSALSLQGRHDLLKTVDERDLNLLNKELNFQKESKNESRMENDQI